MKYDWTTAEAWGKTGAVFLASTGLYLSFCVFCVTAVPVARDVAVTTGLLVGFPVWIGAMCYAVLARTTPRAWGVLLAAALVLAGGSVFATQFL